MTQHINIMSKMRKTRALLDHPIIAQHVPETVWYDSLKLMEMLARHRVVYIKPDSGFQGKNVVRVQKVDEFNGVVSYNSTSKNIPLPDIPSELGTILIKTNYIIQQGIDLASYKNCPFDIRMIMQKPSATWELTLTSARVALWENAVVTNLSSGARQYPLNEILQKYDQKQDPMVALRELVNLAHQLAHILGARFPFRIIGLDMAIDKQGKVWFIEGNTNPQARAKRVNDKISRQRYKEAKQIIKSGQIAGKESAHSDPAHSEEIINPE